MAAGERMENDAICQGDVRSFYEELDWLLNNKEYSDVRFSVGPEERIIYGHKCIISARCPFFKQMFDEMNPDDVCSIHGISTPDFLALLEFIYTNCCSKLTQENVFDILAAANKYGLGKMTKICEDFLMKHVTVERACESMEAAVTFDLDRLFKEVMLYFEKYTLKIFKSDSFKEMSASTVARIMQSDKLLIDEYEICSIVKEWATVNSVALEIPVSEVSEEIAKFIRLPLLSPEELSRIENENKDHFIPVDQILQAWKHIALKTPVGSTVETTPRRGTKQRPRDSS